jgi:ABC-type transport system involved in cytochrome c biogenesis permease subunit
MLPFSLISQGFALQTAFSLSSALVVASLANHVGLVQGQRWQQALNGFGVVSGLSLLLLLALRSVEAGFFAVSTMYESVLLVAASVQLGLVALARTHPNETLFRVVAQVAVVLILLFANGLASEPTALQASLRSYWRAIHVPIILASYALFALNMVATLVAMWQSYRKQPSHQAAELAFQAAVVGFPLLTIGVMLGAVWANEAWGTYWNWDPKESMALATLLGYAVYIHLKLTTNLSQQALNAVAVGAFVLLVVTYVGVNLMGVGLHSYGNFTLG